jgi:membrane protein
VNEEKEKRSLLWLNLVSLTFTIAGLFAMLTAVGAVVVMPLLLSAVGLAGMTEEIVRFARRFCHRDLVRRIGVVIVLLRQFC